MSTPSVDAESTAPERVTRVAPFGVRFVDPVTDQVVSDLEVTMARAGRSDPQMPLASSPSGAFYLSTAPGLREFTFGRGDQAFWAQAPAPTTYRLHVRDGRRRYLPFVAEVGVPHRGLFTLPYDPSFSPPEVRVPGIPLFAGSSLPAPAGMGVVRAQLFDALLQRPAAWAVLDLTYGGKLWGRGIADGRGAVAVFLPYPPPVDYLPGSPLQTGASLWQQEWQFAVQIYYAPTRDVPPGLDADAELDLDRVLDQLGKPPATAWEDYARTTPLTVATLRYGIELALRSFSAGSLAPELLVTPALSPL